MNPPPPATPSEPPQVTGNRQAADDRTGGVGLTVIGMPLAPTDECGLGSMAAIEPASQPPSVRGVSTSRRLAVGRSTLNMTDTIVRLDFTPPPPPPPPRAGGGGARPPPPPPPA